MAAAAGDQYHTRMGLGYMIFCWMFGDGIDNIKPFLDLGPGRVHVDEEGTHGLLRLVGVAGLLLLLLGRAGLDWHRARGLILFSGVYIFYTEKNFPPSIREEMF